MLLSLISPQKNVEEFVINFKESLEWITKYTDKIELIIVDDNSSDNTWHVLNKIFSNFVNVSIIKNSGNGKIDALNFGFSKAKGKYVRFIDGDDFLLEEAFNSALLAKGMDADAYSSSFEIKVNKKSYPVLSKFLRINIFDINTFYSPPRWNWTLKKSFVATFFPIPSALPFEDLYIAIIVSQSAKKIIASPNIDYVYFQHENQTYGGINKSSRDLLNFRAERNLTVLKYMNINLKLNPGVVKLMKNQKDIINGKLNFKNMVLQNPGLFKFAFKIKMLIEHIFYRLYKGSNNKVYYLND